MRILVSILIALGWTLGGCQAAPPLPPSIAPGIAIAADCGAPVVRDVATHLLDDVTSALMTTGDWRAALSAVAARAGDSGAEAVKCAVGDLLAQSSDQLALRARMEADAVDRTTLMHDRALTWLGEHPAP